MIQLLITLTIMFGWYKIGYSIASGLALYHKEPDWADIGMGMILGIIVITGIAAATYGIWALVGFVLN